MIQNDSQNPKLNLIESAQLGKTNHKSSYYERKIAKNDGFGE